MKNSIRILVAALAIGGTIAGTTAFALRDQPLSVNTPVLAVNTYSSSYFRARTESSFLKIELSKKQWFVECSEKEATPLTITFVTSNTATLSWDDSGSVRYIGVSTNNQFSTSQTVWNISNGVFSAQDSKKAERTISWNDASNAKRATCYKTASAFPAIYFYSQPEFDDNSSRCNWSAYAIECLNNLIHKNS